MQCVRVVLQMYGVYGRWAARAGSWQLCVKSQSVMCYVFVRPDVGLLTHLAVRAPHDSVD